MSFRILRASPAFVLLAVAVLALTNGLFSPTARAAATALPAGCPRPVAGSVVTQPTDLYSKAGVLSVVLDYVTSLDSDNRTLFCFVTADGIESPTLHVRPGDTLRIVLRNTVPALPNGTPRETMSVASNVCGSPSMDATSVNMHFHGTNTPPVCHSDQVVHTLVNAGESFVYSVAFPRDEPPGLYWYHPHVHGISEAAVQGGASGAIVVDGIENVQPAVAGLPARLLVMRDQVVAGNPDPGGAVPAWDVTLNYVPIAYPALTPAVIALPPGRREFWRFLNASADTIADVRLSYDGVAQPLEIVALDGVATGSQDGTRQGKTITASHILVPPAGRAEFIVTTPTAGVAAAILETLKIDTGPDGDNDTRRTLAVLRTAGLAPDSLQAMPAVSDMPGPQRFESDDKIAVTAFRHLYFSEVLSDPNNAASPTNFYITVDGATPTLFSSANPPAIVTTQGAVEEWTIQNRSKENHEFHIHQIHFKVLARDGALLPQDQQQYVDTVQVPYWSGTGPFPSVRIRLDFRGRITGDFVYHCHILGHEDSGMMAIIRVLPRQSAGSPAQPG